MVGCALITPGTAVGKLSGPRGMLDVPDPGTVASAVPPVTSPGDSRMWSSSSRLSSSPVTKSSKTAL
jgi:hypothetical protein